MRKAVIMLAILSVAAAVFAIPVKTYLPVPFLCQAPYGNWNQPWQDACEEAAIIMAIKYMEGEQLNRRTVPRLRSGQGAQEILDMVAFQRKHYGGHYDLTAKQMAQLIKDYYKYDKVEVRYDIEVEDIKKELAKGNLVIAPMAGRLLGNPFYTPPGPAYHAILFNGYNDRTKEFVTSDCGTKRGKNYRYKYKVAYRAIHDWTGSKKTIAKGRKAIIVVR